MDNQDAHQHYNYDPHNNGLMRRATDEGTSSSERLAPNDRSVGFPSRSSTDPGDQNQPVAKPKRSGKICGKCGESLTGQFVRALGDTYHLECFTCHVRTLLCFRIRGAWPSLSGTSYWRASGSMHPGQSLAIIPP